MLLGMNRPLPVIGGTILENSITNELVIAVILNPRFFIASDASYEYS